MSELPIPIKKSASLLVITRWKDYPIIWWKNNGIINPVTFLSIPIIKGSGKVTGLSIPLLFQKWRDYQSRHFSKNERIINLVTFLTFVFKMLQLRFDKQEKRSDDATCRPSFNSCYYHCMHARRSHSGSFLLKMFHAYDAYHNSSFWTKLFHKIFTSCLHSNYQ